MARSTLAPAAPKSSTHMAHAGPAARLGILHALWSAMESFYQQFARRQGVGELLELDDHMLCDLGLTRADVIRAVNMPLDYSAAHDLNAIRQRASRRPIG